MALSSNPLSMLMLLPWAVFWLVGGWWLVRAAFRLEANEELVAGAALGWVVQNWLANLIARILPVAPAFWLAALLVFIGGGLAAGLRLGWKELVRGRIAFWQAAVLLGIT